LFGFVLDGVAVGTALDVRVRNRGMHKNANRLFVGCGLVNLYTTRRILLRTLRKLVFAARVTGKNRK
jgi:hypothetical protein